MASEYTLKQISDFKNITDGSADCDFDFHITLPQYMDDLLKIVKSSAVPYITGYEKTKNEIKFYGKTKIDIIYISSNDNCIKTYSCDEDFSKTVSINLDLPDNSAVKYKTIKKYDSTRMINQRRIDIHSSFSIDYFVFSKYECEIISDCNNLKKNILNTKKLNYCACATEKIDFCEQIGNTEENVKIKSIINTFSNVNLKEINIVQDKALIKAQLRISVIYTIDDNDESINKFSTLIDINKIIDVSGIDEKSLCICNLDVQNICTTAKADENGELKIFEVAGRIGVNFDAFCEENENFIIDAYCPGKNISCEFETINNGCLIAKIKDKTLFKSVVSFDSIDISEICDLTVNCIKTEIKCDSTVKIKAKLMIEIIYKSTDGNMMFAKTTEDLEYDTSINEKNISGLSNIEFLSFDYIIKSQNKIEIRLDSSIDAILCKKNNIKALKSFSDTDDKTIETPALVIYFANEKDNVWNIAKKFSSDVDLIIKENDLTSDIIESKRILMIPGI